MAKVTYLIPIDSMREHFEYDPDTGTITNKKSRKGAAAGSMAGVDNGHGYRRIRFNGNTYFSHRVAWALFYGEQPPDMIDHIDGNGLNNSIFNMRGAVQYQNSGNQRLKSNNTTGYKGVCFFKPTGKFMAKVGTRHLGYFDTAEDAHAAYVAGAVEYFGEFARAG